MRKKLWLLLALSGLTMTLPSKTIPTFQQGGLDIQTLSYSYDSTTVYMAAKESWRGSYDIYCSQLQNGQWTKALIVQELSSDQDEMFVCLAADGENIYFVRSEVVVGQKNKESSKTTIFVSTRTPQSWTQAEPIIISTGEDLSPVLSTDCRTLYFLSRRKITVADSKPQELYSIYYTKRFDKYNMYVPKLLLQNLSKNEIWSDLSLSADNSTLSYTKSIPQKRDTLRSRETISIPQEMQQDAVLTLTGKVTDEDSGKPLVSTITVIDAVSSNILQTHKTYAWDGSFRLPLPQGVNYNIDITAGNYSHRYLNYDCTQLQADKEIYESVQLVRNLDITLYCFDSDLQMPITPDRLTITEHGLSKALPIRPQTTDNTMRLLLPIGKDYDITLSKRAYKSNILNLNTQNDVLLSHSELDVLLVPDKALAEIHLIDKQSAESVSGNISIVNTTRREQLSPTQQGLGYSISLRQLDTYAIKAEAAGYLFKDTTVTIPVASEASYSLYLTPLQADMTVQLRNIQFELNSFYLMDESYAELDEVVKLLETNPNLKIEISAHTDDLGTDAYNNKLSQKRGDAAAKYIIRQGISPERITAKGYGKRQPLVENNSDENRAINRRVEFKVLGL